MIADSATRVPRQTAAHINAQIQLQMEDHVARCAAAGPEAIQQRLAALDREWDVERTLEANAATLSLLGFTLGATVHRKWLFLPVVVASFLWQHAMQGWCPPLPVLRRLGFRTRREIDTERYALRLLRGDFQDIPVDEIGHDRNAVRRVLQIVQQSR